MLDPYTCLQGCWVDGVECGSDISVQDEHHKEQLSLPRKRAYGDFISSSNSPGRAVAPTFVEFGNQHDATSASTSTTLEVGDGSKLMSSYWKYTQAAIQRCRIRRGLSGSESSQLQSTARIGPDGPLIYGLKEQGQASRDHTLQPLPTSSLQAAPLSTASLPAAEQELNNENGDDTSFDRIAGPSQATPPGDRAGRTRKLEFSVEDDLLLRELRAKHLTWDIIAQQLQRSAHACSSRHKLLQAPFTPLEDELIAEVSKSSNSRQLYEPLKKLDRELGRELGACQARWRELQSKHSNNTSRSLELSSLDVLHSADDVTTSDQRKLLPLTTDQGPVLGTVDTGNPNNYQLIFEAAERAPVDNLQAAWQHIAHELGWTEAHCKQCCIQFAIRADFTPKQDAWVVHFVRQSILQRQTMPWAELDSKLQRGRGECAVRWFVHLGTKHLSGMLSAGRRSTTTCATPANSATTTSNVNDNDGSSHCARDKSQTITSSTHVPSDSASTQYSAPRYIQTSHKDHLSTREEELFLAAAESASIHDLPAAWKAAASKVGRYVLTCKGHWCRIAAQAALFSPAQDAHIVGVVNRAVAAKEVIPWLALDETLQCNRGDCIRRWWLVLHKAHTPVTPVRATKQTGNKPVRATKQTVNTPVISTKQTVVTQPAETYPQTPPARFTLEEDQLIVATVLRARSDGVRVPWPTIEQHMPHHTATVIQVRWSNVLVNYVDRFTSIDDLCITGAVQEADVRCIPVSWAKLDEQCGRSSGECKGRWRVYLCCVGRAQSCSVSEAALVVANDNAASSTSSSESAAATPSGQQIPLIPTQSAHNMSQPPPARLELTLPGVVLLTTITNAPPLAPSLLCSVTTSTAPARARRPVATGTGSGGSISAAPPAFTSRPAVVAVHIPPVARAAPTDALSVPCVPATAKSVNVVNAASAVTAASVTRTDHPDATTHPQSILSFTLHQDQRILEAVRIAARFKMPVPWAALDSRLSVPKGCCLERWEQALQHS